jgi:hypothetical protein
MFGKENSVRLPEVDLCVIVGRLLIVARPLCEPPRLHSNTCRGANMVWLAFNICLQLLPVHLTRQYSRAGK